MPDFSDSLRKFFLRIAGPEIEITDNSLLKERLEKLEDISTDSEMTIKKSEILLKSALDATCLSILSGNLEKDPTTFGLSIDEINKIDKEDDRKEGLNSNSKGSSRDWLFENRVRAWYGTYLDKTFPDLTQKHDDSVCEFLIQDKDFERLNEDNFDNQLIECKRFNGSLVEMTDEKLARKFEKHFEKATETQFPSTESSENLENPKRHLLLEITDYSTAEREIKAGNSKCKVEGCDTKEIERVKKIIENKYDHSKIDQITLVWTELFKNNGKVKEIAEQTRAIVSDSNVKNYEGWNFFGHEDLTGNRAFGKLLCHHEAKSDEWMTASLDAEPQNNQVYWTQEKGRPT